MDASRIESALQRVSDQTSFVQELLIDTLGWPIDQRAEVIEDIAYEWTEEELHAAGLNEKIVGGKAYQIVLPGNPWGIFVMEFANPDVFTTGRGMTGVLRRVLQGLVRRGRSGTHPNLPRFTEDNLLFICSNEYQRYRFAHFKPAPDKTHAAPMSSFGWGPDDLDAVRTICEFNLRALEWPHSPPTTEADWLHAWTPAFDIEKVTASFYQDYSQVFHDVEGLIGAHNTLDPDDLRMFTQSLFNRLMFLRFIERKGWLTLPGQHGTRYLAQIAAAGGTDGRSLYISRLAPLFFDGLARDGHQTSDAYGRVPLLNGGLFERAPLDELVDDVPDEALAPVIGQGGLFYRYNFTVEESTPLDIEVAVDPEMLGKVFEELVNYRHDSGAYYTPRPVVSYMCREALKGHLTDRTSAPPESIGALVDDHAVEGLTEAHAKAIIDEIDTLKTLDPACGSGAYLLGMLHELIAVRRALQSDKLAADPGYLYDLKLHTIRESLYGVDVDPFATEIAKLRLWLSLAVEADVPDFLPNLDFKIETGDSLLGPDPWDTPDLFQSTLKQKADELHALKDGFVVARGAGKQETRTRIASLESEIREELAEQVGRGVIEWRIQFADVFAANGGFDIVLANPPYVRKENIPASSKPALRRNFADAVTGRSDLYCSFYARAVQLLRDGGMHVFICSSAWLDAEYGVKLQDYLLDRCEVVSVVDSSVEKQFTTANVNTVITVLRKRRTDDDMTRHARFVLLDGPFNHAIRNPASQRVVALTQRHLRDNGTLAGEYVGDKWGGKYLRAPAIYKHIVEKAGDALSLVSSVATIVGYIHDNNTGADFPARHVMWRVSEASCIHLDRNTPGVESIGIKPTGNSTLFAPLLFPRQHGLRHIVLWAHAGVLGKEFYRIVPNDGVDTMSLAAQLNSTFAILQREILGIKGFGGGALKFAARDVGLFQVIADLDVSDLAGDIDSMAHREIGHGPEELAQPDRRAIDARIFDAIGLTPGESAAVYEAVTELLDLRRTKAKSTRGN